MEWCFAGRMMILWGVSVGVRVSMYRAVLFRIADLVLWFRVEEDWGYMKAVLKW